MQFISEMHAFHVRLGDINIDDGTGIKDSGSCCGGILHIRRLLVKNDLHTLEIVNYPLYLLDLLNMT